MTTITLPADVEAWAQEEVSAGRAPSVEDFVAETMRERREVDAAHKELVQQAYRQLERGEALSEAEMEAQFERWLRDSAE